VDNLYSGAYDRAAKLASKAQDGAVKINGQEYQLTFDRAHWHYVVTCGGERVVALNVKTLAIAKRELRQWLNS
jgi:hypothetical protein